MQQQCRQTGVAVGALLAVGLVLLPRLHESTSDVGAVAGVLFVGSMAGGTIAARRRAVDAVFGLEGDPVLIRRFAGAVIACAAVVLALAAYVDPPVALPVAAAAATAIAWALAGIMDQPQSSEGRRAIARGVAVGMLACVLGPPLLSAVSEFVATREWSFGLADTTPGRRFVAALGCSIVVVAAAALAGRADDDETEDDPFGDADGSGPSILRHDAALGTGGERPLLQVENLDVRYGKVQVLFGASLHVGEGDSLALLGTNGAGKSTVLRAVYGLKAPSAGRVLLDGEDITGEPAESLVHRGLIQVPGGKGIFPSLTVADNLRMAGYLHRDESRSREGIDRTLAVFPALKERLDQPAGVMSGGEQQMLALGRAWIARPRLLAIDELTLGLAPVVVDELKAVVRELRAEGVSMILVEQSVHVALELTERACFLERGRVRFDGHTKDLAGRDDLLRSIFFAGAGVDG